jgi:hypothetical protein
VIYHGIANYVYNTGKVFFSDPDGSSDNAVSPNPCHAFLGAADHIAPSAERLRQSRAGYLATGMKRE